MPIVLGGAEEDQEVFEQYMWYFYNLSPYSRFNISFEKMLEYYSKYGAFSEGFVRASEIIGIDKTKAALYSLAMTVQPPAFLHYTKFLNQLGLVTVPGVKEVIEGTKEGLKQAGVAVGTVAAIGVSSWLLYGALGIVGASLLLLRGKRA